jgi:hypothetical protein
MIKIIRGIVGMIVGGFSGWVAGLFFHIRWWFIKGITGDPFDISSGLFLYTLPYAVTGALVGAVKFAEKSDEMSETFDK